MPGLKNTRPLRIDTDLPSGSIKGKRGSTVKDEKPFPIEIPGYIKARYSLMTLPEYQFGWCANKLGFTWDWKTNQGDVIYQYPLLQVGEYKRGHGSTVADWLCPEEGKVGYPSLAVYVNGNFWHYGQGIRSQLQDLDIIRRIQVQYKFDVVVVDEDDLARDAIFHTREALLYRRAYSQYEGRY